MGEAPVPCGPDCSAGQPAAIPLNLCPSNSLGTQSPASLLADSEPIDLFDFIARDYGGPHHHAKARVRLSAGRLQMGEAVQALCFMAGANLVFTATSCW